MIATHVQSTHAGSQLLRRTLQLDGIICLAAGLPVALAASPIARLMGIPSSLALGVLGAALAGYGALLVAAARQERIDRRVVTASLVAELLWIAGSAALLLGDLLPLTTAGWWIVLVVALDVVAIADAKLWGLWRTR